MNIQATILLLLFGFFGNCVTAQSRTDVSAVGLLILPKGGGCTGTLIAPDLVLTAAHCLLSSIDDKPSTPSQHQFLPSMRGGKPGKAIVGKHMAVHPIYLLPGLAAYRKMSRDIGLLQLAEEVPNDIAVPILTGALRKDDIAGFLMSYRGPNGGPARQRKCPFIKAEQGLIEIACDVRSGESGSPLLVRRDGVLTLVGVVSSRGKHEDQPIGLVAESDAGLAGLFEAAGLKNTQP